MNDNTVIYLAFLAWRARNPTFSGSFHDWRMAYIGRTWQARRIVAGV